MSPDVSKGHWGQSGPGTRCGRKADQASGGVLFACGFLRARRVQRRSRRADAVLGQLRLLEGPGVAPPPDGDIQGGFDTCAL